MDTLDDGICWIVSCTKKKIWDVDKDAPKHVPAYNAYKGSTFLKWLLFVKDKESKGEYIDWYIFSSKYGIIKPYKEIENYDMHFINNADQAISEDELIEKIKKLSQKNYKDFYFIGSDEYYMKLKDIFKKEKIDLWWCEIVYEINIQPI
ncbi:hypothetical protein KKP97_01460 [Methanothermococcus sp. SCGC AD-155-C09]|nr:hypothetical protein [Methanothermococcus sp. SCGC AD-155-C09]